MRVGGNQEVTVNSTSDDQFLMRARILAPCILIATAMYSCGVAYELRCSLFRELACHEIHILDAAFVWKFDSALPRHSRIYHYAGVRMASVVAKVH